jgi:2'-5' RNA ligase
MHKYVIVYLFNPVEDGFIFSNTDWPLHITFCQLFSVDARSLGVLSNELAELVGKFIPTKTIGEDEAMFGPNDDVPVITVKKTLELINYHERLLDIVDRYRPIYIEPVFMRNNFHPHATIQKTTRIYVNDIVYINSLTLVDCENDDDNSIRKALKTFKMRADIRE